MRQKKEPILISFEAIESEGIYYLMIPTEKYYVFGKDNKNIVIASKETEQLKLNTIEGDKK